MVAELSEAFLAPHLTVIDTDHDLHTLLAARLNLSDAEASRASLADLTRMAADRIQELETRIAWLRPEFSPHD